MKRKIKIPDNVVRRLPKYLRCCDVFVKENKSRIRSSDIADALDVSSSMVRHDLSYFGDFGNKGMGYSPKELQLSLKAALGLVDNRSAVIVGVGGIGRLMLEYLSQNSSCCALTAGFDVDEAIIGTELSSVPIYNVCELEAYIKLNEPDICIISTPDNIAKQISDSVLACGVSAILNLTNVDIPSPYNAFVENVHLYDSILRLDYYLRADCKKTQPAM